MGGGVAEGVEIEVEAAALEATLLRWEIAGAVVER